jgi:UDP-N-acetylmuramate--alanine ligase
MISPLEIPAMAPAMPVSTSGIPMAASRSLAGHPSAYLVGIGGTGMCGAAVLLKARGLAVAGSDRSTSRRTERLASVGISVDVGDTAEIPADVSVVIATAAASASHPQLVEARRRGLPVWKYAECLGALMDGRVGIAVAGCHGKTTTSSLVATALWRAGRDPSFVIGGEVRDLATSARPGRGPHFVAEACEYDRSFHRLRPTIALITNVDADHLDYYRDMEEIRESFRDFAGLLPRDGVLVVHEDHADVFRRDPRLVARIETYGFSADAKWRAVDARWDDEAQAQRFTLVRDGEEASELSVPLTGTHNVANATGAAAALFAAGLTVDEIASGIAAFGGVGRRLETVADCGGVLVLDDYGHHPAEIAAVIRGLRGRFPGRRVVVIFQPHQASRTRSLLDEFGDALSGADEAWLAPIYLARDSEEDRRSVSSADVAAKIVARGGTSSAFSDFAAVVDHAATHVRPGDVVVTMGAGTIDEVARSLAHRLADVAT